MLFGKHVNRYYLRYGAWILLGLLSLTIVDYMQLKIPAFYQLVINGINDGTVLFEGQVRPFDLDFLLDEICLPMLFVILSLVVGRFLWRICLFGTGIRVETDLRARMFSVSKELSETYYQYNKVGNLMSLYTNDVETVQDCFGMGIMMFFDALILGGLSLWRMGGMDLLLMLLSLIPMALLVACSLLISRYMMKKWDRRQAAFSDLSDFSQESFSGLAVIKAFVKEGKELLAFRRINRQNEDANVDYTRLSTLLRVCVTLFVESVVCVILGYGGYLVYRGTFNAGQLVEFIGYFTSIVWPVTAISELIEMRSRGKASLARIGELLDAKPDVCDREDVTPLPEVKGKIELRSLSFRYPGKGYDNLTDVSFTVAPGEQVGIIGKTGSGKTTIADLLLRIYNVRDGMLFLDGRDVNTLPIRQVRNAIAYVPQDGFLFSDTIANNIAFGEDNVPREAVENAARTAGVHDDIAAFPEGYETVLGERGVTVSGGQKQRISIARALCKDAPVLILDDSLSAVDTKTERDILTALRESRKGKTTLMIAHRVSTVEHMDKIVYIERGHVKAVGTHAELYETCPAYRTTVDLQRLEEEEDA